MRADEDTKTELHQRVDVSTDEKGEPANSPVYIIYIIYYILFQSMAVGCVIQTHRLVTNGKESLCRTKTNILI